MTPQELGEKIYGFLHISKGDTVILSRDRLSQSLLITREERSDSSP